MAFLTALAVYILLFNHSERKALSSRSTSQSNFFYVAKKETAKLMKLKNVDIALIKEITGLSEAEIEKFVMLN